MEKPKKKEISVFVIGVTLALMCLPFTNCDTYNQNNASVGDMSGLNNSSLCANNPANCTNPLNDLVDMLELQITGGLGTTHVASITAAGTLTLSGTCNDGSFTNGTIVYFELENVDANGNITTKPITCGSPSNYLPVEWKNSSCTFNSCQSNQWSIHVTSTQFLQPHNQWWGSMTIFGIDMNGIRKTNQVGALVPAFQICPETGCP